VAAALPFDVSCCRLDERTAGTNVCTLTFFWTLSSVVMAEPMRFLPSCSCWYMKMVPAVERPTRMPMAVHEFLPHSLTDLLRRQRKLALKERYAYLRSISFSLSLQAGAPKP
jgi:hypothetical protein